MAWRIRLGCSDSISSPRTGVEAILTELGPETQNRRYAVSSHVAGLAINPVQVFRTGRAVYWEFLRLRTGFELPSSWPNPSGLNLNRNILDFMRWPQIDLGAQDLNDIQRPKSFQKIAGSKVLGEYYNTYLRK
jgi:hypothetical protein